MHLKTFGAIASFLISVGAGALTQSPDYSSLALPVAIASGCLFLVLTATFLFSNRRDIWRRAKLIEPTHVIVLGLLIALSGVIWQSSRGRSAASQQSAQSPPAAKTYSKRTVRELLDMRKGRSGLEAAKLLEPFRGLWIPPVNGKVGAMAQDGSSGTMVVVRDGDDVLECHFSAKWVSELYQYRENDALSVTGKINHYTGPTLLVLTDCEIVK